MKKKCDQEQLRDVENSVAQSFAEENNLIFFETSAKNDVNVNEIFVTIARKVPLQKPRQQDDIFNFDSNPNFNDNNQTGGGRRKHSKQTAGGNNPAGAPGGGCGCG